MSGHSKWASIKHKKGAADAKRGKIFNRHARLIEVAARAGGGDVDTNVRLRAEVQAAKGVNMPKDKIEKAIAKGSGQIKGVTYEEAVYEAYGTDGVALMIDVLTDNKNRTVGEIRSILTKHNGHLGEGGSVAWNFTQKGLITVPVEGNEEDRVLEVALEAGAEDLATEGENFEVTTNPKDFATVRNALDEAGIAVEHAEVTRIPGSTVELDQDAARKILKLMDALDDQDDVQNVSANFDIPDEIMEALKDEG
jgi:YebC/PmpR family DNA-binding regulatory protein